MQQYRDITGIPISVFTSSEGHFCSEHYIRPIEAFLHGGKHYAATINEIRATRAFMTEAWENQAREDYDRYAARYKALKQQLPCAILQGVCPTHKDNGFTAFSDIMCLDIDEEKPHKGRNGNEWVKDNGLGWAVIRDKLARNPHVAFVSLSAGGRGVFVVIPIASHEHHAEHFAALRTLFKTRYGLHIDEAAKNVSRLRYISFDEAARINPHALVFEGVESLREASAPIYQYVPQDDDTARRIEQAVTEIETRHIDITGNYEDWVKGCAAVAHYLGENGRSLFHRMARQYPGYNHRENDRLYTNLMQRSYNGKKADIATFFWLCDQYGVKPIKRRYSGDKRPKIDIPTLPSATPHKHPVQTGEKQAVKHDDLTVEEQSKTPSEMSKAEAAEYERRRHLIDEGLAILKGLEASNPAVKRLRRITGARFRGVDDFVMTDAQFDKFMSEHPEPPF